MNILSILFAATAVAGRAVDPSDVYESVADEPPLSELLRDSIDTARTEADKIRTRADERIADKELKIIELMEDRERVKAELERSQEWREDALAKRDAAIVKVRSRIDSIINKAEQRIDDAAESAEDATTDAQGIRDCIGRACATTDEQAEVDAIRELIAERKAAAEKVRSDLKDAISVEMTEMKKAIDMLKEQLSEKRAESKNESRRLNSLADPKELVQMVMEKKDDLLESVMNDKMAFLGGKIPIPTALQGQAFGDPIQKLQMAFDELKSKFNKFLSMEGLGF